MAKSQLTASEKRAQKRKDLVKNILIVFLVLMLLLTFFSGTIQNWSLPEVSTNRVESATVSPQIRGAGVLEAEDPYNVVLSQSRKIASVAVKVGDEVKKDDPIYRLEDTDSKELDEALAALRKLETEYELALFGEGVTDSAIARARSGNTDSIDGYQAQRKNMSDRLLAAQEADEAVAARITALEEEHKQILADLGEADTSAQKHAAADVTADKSILQSEKSLRQQEITAILNKLANDYPLDYQNDPDFGQASSSTGSTQQNQIPHDSSQNTGLSAAYIEAKTNAIASIQILNDAIAGIDYQLSLIDIQGAEITREASHITTEKEQQIAAEKKRYETALEALNEEKLQTAAALAEVTEEQAEFIANAKTEITLSAYQEEIDVARRKVERLRETSIGGEVTAPVDGIISSLAYVAGQTIPADETCAVIQIAGKAMAVHFSVTNEQAKQLKVGDQAEPQNSWQYSQFKATLSAIKPDKEDPSGKKQLTFSIDSPEVQAGQTVAIKIGQSSRTYEMTVPNSAIREDNNGKFILIIEEKASPLRNRYIARRADIEVIASDDTKSAITAAIEGWEYVITTANAPIKPGDEVRLASSSY